ncbi:MAG: S8 family serine peptidase [Bacteroidia bacterium]|nr:S8 family serine peptidase [Bacteroidia bacterium]
MKKIAALLLISVLGSGFYANAQNKRKATDASTTADLQLLFSENFRIDQNKIALKAKELNVPVREVLPNGVVREMVSISYTGLPVYIHTNNNLDAAKTLQTNKLWPAGSLGLSLSGQGMTNRLGVWDGGAVLRTHQEFQGRAVQTDGATSLSSHATHVTGTMIAGGVVTNAKGMSYQAPIKCHDWNNDNSEMSSAASVGLLISNHSYAQICGWQYNSGASHWEFWGDQSISATEDYKYGFYDDNSESWDQIAVSYPNYLIFVAAGNDRGAPGTIPSVFYIRNSIGSWVQGSNTNVPATVGPYNSISGGPCNAKNVMTIGAVNKITNGWSKSSDVVMSSFSGWGPTDDGRIKPDVVANGVSVYSSVSSGTTDYDTYNGTSMATPNASGSALLIQQHYNALKGSYMRSATLKGLIIHTADEAGAAFGPDYTYGWGLMNAAKAVQTISDTLKSSIQQKNLINNASYTYTFFSDGITPIRASICWTDLPGNALSPALNPNTKMLINDLDLRIKRNSDNLLYFPYKLNPAIPAAPSTTGDNITDNVEQVYINAPALGTYTITISHKGSLSGGSQPYSLIISGISPKPAARFTVSSKVVCTNKNIQFFDQSSGSSTRMWYFSGGTPAASSQSNPLVTFSLPGIYSVALRISGPNGYDSLYMQDYITVGGLGLPLDETFEPNSLTRDLWTIEKTGNDTSWRYWSIGGTSPGNTAYGINNYDAPSAYHVGRLISPVLDLRGYLNAQVTFQHAYTRYDNTGSDSLIVYVSTNCGNVWTRLLNMGENGTGNYATGPDNTFQSQDAFIPSKSSNWCGGGFGAACKTINLTSYAGNANVMVRFEQRTNNGGNNIFIDNVKITGTLTNPVANFYAFSKTVCAMDDVQILDSSQNNPSQWKWYFTDTDTLTYTARNPNVKFLTPGLKTIILAVKNAVGTDSVLKAGYITVLPSPIQPTLTSSNGNSLCNGDSTTLSTNATSNFTWFRNGIVQSTPGNSIQVKDEATYFIKTGSSNGCYAKSEVLDILTGITPPKPVISKNLASNSFCEGSSFNLTSNADLNNQWFVNGLSQTGQTAKVFSFSDSGTFKVQVGDKGCFSISDILHIDKLPRPITSEISGANWSVRDDTASFSVIPGINGSNFNWLVTGGSVQSGAGTNGVNIKFNSGSNAAVSVQENTVGGCKGVQKTLAVKLVSTGISKNTTSINLNMYPNPASNILTFDFELYQKGNVHFQIYNLVGLDMISVTGNFPSGVNQKHIDVNKLIPGFYMVSIKTGDKMIIRNFVKE